MPDQVIDNLYSSARNRGQWGQLWAVLTRRSRHLLPLDEIDVPGEAHAHYRAEVRSVPIRLIRGSQGRSYDFDRDFNPLRDHNKSRWLGVASARQRGKALPPVELIQFGDVYFVQDGHHRISVARALGQRDIEAKVMVLNRAPAA